MQFIDLFYLFIYLDRVNLWVVNPNSSVYKQYIIKKIVKQVIKIMNRAIRKSLKG